MSAFNLNYRRTYRNNNNIDDNALKIITLYIVINPSISIVVGIVSLFSWYIKLNDVVKLSIFV